MKMAGLILASAFLAIAAAPDRAFAQERTAESFYQEASKFQKKGALALLSMGKVKALMGEVKDAMAVARAEREAALAAGQTPRFCPPEKGSMDDKQLMAGLGAIPQAERRKIGLSEGITRVMARKYPCR